MRFADPLLLVFAAHNAEEVAHLPTDLAAMQPVLERRSIDVSWLGQPEMSVATALLTALSAGLLKVGDERPGAVGDVLSLAVCGALGGNAVTHVVRAAAQRRYNGGLGTSPLMFVAAVRRARVAVRSGRLTPAQATAAVIGGNLLVPPLIVLSLGTARRLTALTRKNATRKNAVSRPAVGRPEGEDR